MKTPKHQLINHPNRYHEKYSCIEILDGDMKGLVYQYDVINYKEDDIGGLIDFTIVIISNKNKVKVIDDVLSCILLDTVKNELKEFATDVPRNTDNKASDT